MNYLFKPKTVKFFATTLISVLTITYLFLDPLGGLDYLKSIANQKILWYIVLISIAILISLLLTSIRFHAIDLKESGRKNITETVVGKDRSQYNYLDVLNGTKQKVNLL